MRYWILLLLVLCPVVFAGPKDILVVQSYHAEYSWDRSYLEGIREGLGDEYTIHTFEMDTKRLPAESFPLRAEMAMEEYKKIEPELVILGDDNALKYLAPKLKDTKTPIVFLGINADIEGLLDSGYENMTGVLERPLFSKAITDIRKIVRPRPRKILILFDSGETSSIAVNEVFEGDSTIKFGALTAEAKTIGNFDEWKNAVSNARKEGFQAIMLGLYHTLTDAAGNHVDSEKVLSWTSASSDLPLFAFWDFAVGKGKAIGGLVLLGKEQGLMAARLSSIVLKGVRPSSIKPVTSEGRFVYSKAEMERWNFTVPGTVRMDAITLD